MRNNMIWVNELWLYSNRSESRRISEMSSQCIYMDVDIYGRSYKVNVIILVLTDLINYS